MKTLSTFIFLSGLSLSLQAQLVFDNSYTIEEYVKDVLLGGGVTVSNITFNGDTNIQIVEFSSTNTDIPISQGLMLMSGDYNVAQGPNNNPGATSNLGGSGDVDLNNMSGNFGSFDAAILEFDFVPKGDTIRFNYVFASEEYSEFVDSPWNDAFGFFVSGPGINGIFTNQADNIAKVPVSGQFVTINNVNNGWAITGQPTGPCSNCSYWQYTGDGAESPWDTTNYYTQFDGRTTKLEAKIGVTCDSTYHIKIAISDIGDNALESAVFLEGGSFKAPGSLDLNVETSTGDTILMEGCGIAEFTFVRSDTIGDLWIDIDVAGTATNGVDYTDIPDSLLFPDGEDSISLSISAFVDGVEIDETIIVTVYTITSCGDTTPSTTVLTIPADYILAINTTTDTTLCPGDSLYIGTVASSGVPPYFYSWSNGATTAGFNIVGDNSGNTYTYIVEVEDSCGLVQRYDTVNIQTFEPLQVGATDETVECPGDAALLTGLAGGGAPTYTYEWTWQNGSETGDTIISDPVNGTEQYTFEVTDQCGEKQSITVKVTSPVFDPMDVVTDDHFICPGTPISMGAEASGGSGNYSYNWSGNEVTQEGDSGYAAPTIPGTYTIIVIDHCGNTATAEVDVDLDDCEIIIPNVFTPNGDGMNQFFHIVNIEKHPGNEIFLYNRWGRRVFHKENYDNSWTGKEHPDGTYYYVVNLNNGTDPQSGYVTIIR